MRTPPSTEARAASRLAWTVSPLLLAITALGRASQNAGQTTYPLIGRSLLHVSNSTIGALGAAMAVVGIVCATVVVGRTRHHALTVLTVGQGFGLAAFGLLATPTGQPGLWAAAMALGAYGGLAMPSLMTVIGGGARAERARALAVFALALSTSLLVGPLVESAVLHALGNSLRATFAVLVPVPAAATALAAGAALRHRAELRRRAEAQDEQAGASVTAGPAERFAWRSAPGFRLAVLAMVTYQVPFAGLVAFGALLARHVDGASASGAQLAFGVFFGVSLAVRATLAFTSQQHRSAALLVGSVAATVAGVALVGTARSFPLLLVGMAVLGLPHGSTFPLSSAILAERTPRAQLARANGLLLAANNIVIVIVPFVCGWLADSLGYGPMFLLIEVPVVALGMLLLAQLASPRSPLRGPPLLPAPADAGTVPTADAATVHLAPEPERPAAPEGS